MSNETTVDGVVTDLPPDALEDLKPTETPKEEPQKEEEPKATTPNEGDPAKAEAEKEEPKKDEPRKEEKPEPKLPEGTSRSKPKPIAKLLEKAHTAEERATKAEARIAELEQQLSAASGKSATAAAPDIKALAQKHNLDEAFLAELVAAARGEQQQVQLPKEVAEIIAAHNAQKEQAAELAAFDNRIGRLSATFKDEPIGQHRDKLLELAYSTELAPDGEPFYQKELSELYFGFVKPEIEAGRKTAEPSKGGTQTTKAVLDFEDIHQRDNPADIEGMDDATFQKYQKWLEEKAEAESQPMKKGKYIY